MTLAHLESLKNALTGNAGINGMVDGKIYKFKSIEKSEPDLRSATHKSLISCEVGDWAGGKLSSDPIFIVDIRSRQGTDGGAEYCAEIVKAVKELLDDGFGAGASAVAVSEVRGKIEFEKALISYRCRLEIFGHIKTAPSLSLFSSVASPQPPGLEIELICTATDADGNELLYKFLHQPPGVSYWKDLSGWQSRNWTTWRPTLADSGANSLKVLVIDAKHAEKGGYDASSLITYTINPGITNVLTFYKVGSDDKVYYLVGTTWVLLSNQTVSRISVAPDGTIAAMDLATTALLIWNGSAWINWGGSLVHIVAINSSLVYGIGGDNNIWKNENGAWSPADTNYAKYVEILVTKG